MTASIILFIKVFTYFLHNLSDSVSICILNVVLFSKSGLFSYHLGNNLRDCHY